MTIKKGYKQLVAEANAEIVTLSAGDAIALVGQPEVVFVDLRDPRELEREGKMPGAFACTRGMLEFWIDPESPYAKPLFAGQAVRVLLRRRLALGARGEDGAGHGPGERRPYRRRVRRLEEGRRPG